MKVETMEDFDRDLSISTNAMVKMLLKSISEIQSHNHTIFLDVGTMVKLLSLAVASLFLSNTLTIVLLVVILFRQ